MVGCLIKAYMCHSACSRGKGEGGGGGGGGGQTINSLEMPPNLSALVFQVCCLYSSYSQYT